jgi:shikimate kinase
MNLYLIGYRGCGKSSVAPLVAQQLGWSVVDSDAVIQENAGTTIAQIFADQGEPAFRTLEQSTIAELAKLDRHVVSLGGGAAMFEANRQVMAASGKVVYLSASAEILWARINGDAMSETQRPSLTDDDGFTEVRNVLAARTSVYEACADYRIATDERSVEEVAQEILDWWSMAEKK